MSCPHPVGPDGREAAAPVAVWFSAEADACVATVGEAGEGGSAGPAADGASARSSSVNRDRGLVLGRESPRRTYLLA